MSRKKLCPIREATLNNNITAQLQMQGAPPGMEAMLQNPDMMRNMSSMMANLTPEDMQRMSSMAGAFGGGGGGGGPGAGRTTSVCSTCQTNKLAQGRGFRV